MLIELSDIQKYLSILVIVFSTYFGISLKSTAAVYSCKDEKGKPLFTDGRQKCKADVTELSYSQHRDLRTNYRYPERTYIKQESIYNLYIESPESSRDKIAFQLAVRKLNSALNKVFALLPVNSHHYLKTINFYIMIGPRAKLGGETNVLRYHTPNLGGTYFLSDKRWSHVIVIYDVDDFNSLAEFITTKVMVHELSHAWHNKNYNQFYQNIRDAWLASRGSSLYLSQKTIYGTLATPAYASTNDHEYFAELSATYFIGCEYFPFNRVELQSYDPVGFDLVKRVWDIQ